MSSENSVQKPEGFVNDTHPQTYTIKANTLMGVIVKYDLLVGN